MIALKNIKVKRNILLGYWILVPILFYFYLFLLSFNQQVEISQLIVHIPGLSLTLLLSFLTLFQAAMLYFISSQKEEDSKSLKQFIGFSMIQQIITGNIIGAALCYFYSKNIFVDEKKHSQKSRGILYTALLFISLISIVILFIAIRMRGV